VLDLDNGTAGAIVTNAGTHFISATVNMAGSTTFAVTNSTDVLTISGSITGGGSSSFDKTGSGTLVLSGSNTYGGGGTHIDGGVVQLGNANALPTGDSLVVSSGTLDIHGFSTVNGTLFGNGVIDNLAATPASLTVGNGGTGNSTFSGVIRNTGGALTLITQGSGTLTLTGSNTFSGGLNNSTGTVIVANTASLPTGSAVINNGLLILNAGTSGAPQVTGKISGGGTLDIGSTGSVAFVQLATGSGAHTQGAINVSTGSTLDITNNKVVINYGSAANDPTATVLAEIISGRNSGTWTGTGITSSTAAAASTKFAIGYLDGNKDALGGDIAKANQLIVEYTILGNATLSGTVGFNDLLAVASNFGKTGADWAHGNFNYAASSAAVGFSDLLNVASNFGKSSGVSQSDGAALSAAWLSSAAATTSVTPEPGVLSLVAVGAMGALSRRRRKSQSQA
jgi:autotransporter-associated beta strand protein